MFGVRKGPGIARPGGAARLPGGETGGERERDRTDPPVPSSSSSKHKYTSEALPSLKQRTNSPSPPGSGAGAAGARGREGRGHCRCRCHRRRRRRRHRRTRWRRGGIGSSLWAQGRGEGGREKAGKMNGRSRSMSGCDVEGGWGVRAVGSSGGIVWQARRGKLESS